MKVAIANDSAIAIEALRRILSDAGHTVLWVARNGQEAVDAAIDQRPELLLLDLRMPVMDGVECTRRIMAEAPCAILLDLRMPRMDGFEFRAAQLACTSFADAPVALFTALCDTPGVDAMRL